MYHKNVPLYRMLAHASENDQGGWSSTDRLAQVDKGIMRLPVVLQLLIQLSKRLTK